MSAKIDFIYLSEPDMIKAGVKDMGKCVEVMEDMMVTLNKGDYVMGGENHNSHGCMVTFPDQGYTNPYMLRAGQQVKNYSEYL